MKILPFSCFGNISFIALQAQHWELGICGTTTVQYLEFQTLKRFQICISADARNKNQILMLIKDDKKDLFSFFLSIRKDKSLTQNASWTSKQSLSSLCFLQP